MGKFDLVFLKNKTIHFIGIGGISMSALAYMLLSKNIKIQGSDESQNDEVFKLKNKGITVFDKHKKSNLEGVDVVVYSSAISESNEEFLYAKELGLLIIKRAELLSIIAKEYKTVISIAGSHGKTTTTAMISDIFLNAGKNPTIHLGGVFNKINSNYYIGNSDYFITESCEYKDNFLYIKPDISVVLNIDADHLDYFGNQKNVERSFKKYLNNTNIGGINVLCGDENNLVNIIKTANNVYYGCKNGILIAKNIKILKNDKIKFDVFLNKFYMGNIVLNVFGRHNVYNALASIFVSIVCGIDFKIIKKSLENFSGVQRRMEYLGGFDGVEFYHDYAHHPKQIKEMILVGKGLAKEHRLMVVYEPHTYSRTKFLFDDFIDSFSGLDFLFLLPAYAAREDINMGIDSDGLYNKMKTQNKNVMYFSDYESCLNKINLVAKKGDVVLILGAGSVEKLAKSIKNKEGKI